MPPPVSVTEKMVPHLHPRGAICQKDYFNISHLAAQHSRLSSKAYLTDSNIHCYSLCLCVHKQTDRNEMLPCQCVCTCPAGNEEVSSVQQTWHQHQVCSLWSSWNKLTRTVATFLPVFITCLLVMTFHCLMTLKWHNFLYIYGLLAFYFIGQWCEVRKRMQASLLTDM